MSTIKMLYIIISCNIGNDFSLLTFVAAVFFIYSISCSLIRLFSEKKLSRLTNAICYSSMCTYLFHRSILVLLKKINGDIFSITEAYCICLPAVFLVSYVIQYSYDYVIKKITKTKGIKNVKK